MQQPSLGEKIAGVKPPAAFILDAAVLDFKEEHEIIREDVKRNRIIFRFPNGINKVDLLEICRALTDIENFDLMYDITMQMLENKDLEILLKDDQGVPHQAAIFHITTKDMNLRGIQFIDENEVVVLWLTEFIGAMLLKKFPMPGTAQKSSPQASEKTIKKAKKSDKETSR